MFVKERCSHFTLLPIGMRVLFTGTLIVLGVGYLFAMIHIFASHAGRDGDPGLSVNDLMIAYSGSKSDTQLEVALKGPMAGMLPTQERDEIVAGYVVARCRKNTHQQWQVNLSHRLSRCDA